MLKNADDDLTVTFEIINPDTLTSLGNKDLSHIICCFNISTISNTIYVVFIIDTSGSMKAIWEKVTKELVNILNIHPKVKGFQILNDNGIHLLGAYENKWIPDTPSKRNNIIKILKNWNSASNSSPIEGLEVALKRYTSRKHNTSIYIFGDEFTGGSYTPVFSTIEKLSIKRNIRINGIGFISLGSTNDRFATLMREIAENNNGTFLALPIVGMDLRQ